VEWGIDREKEGKEKASPKPCTARV